MAETALVPSQDLSGLIGPSSIQHWIREPSKNRFVIKVDADWPLFDGHFPGRPILPGIVQLHLAVRFAHHFLERPEQAAEIRQLKFRNVFIPPGQLELELLSVSAHDLSFQVFSAAGVHAQGKLIYAR